MLAVDFSTVETIWLQRLYVLRKHLERVLRVFVDHYNGHRPHRARDLRPADPRPPALRLTPPPQLTPSPRRDHVERRDRLGGLIHEYHLAA
jgi:hypothetical protein